MSMPAEPAAAQGLYAAHRKIYARDVSGRYARLRATAVAVLLGLFYGVPWLRWDGRQAVLFDLPARHFRVWGITFFPQDFILLTALLVIAALSLFFFTALAGRLWCGYACPQTVWTEIYVWMERLAEGGSQRRMKLDRGRWSAEKLLRKIAKQALWITFSLLTGLTFVGYFSPVGQLVADAASLRLASWELFWVVFYSAATYGNAGYLREQVCKYMCPYARFQSAMFDRETLIISYDASRGEPRGALRHGDIHRRGDCVDCTLCVQVCPTGIDIRRGLQYECIACAACVDACDAVMDKIGRPRGLVRYSTQAEMDGGRNRFWRPRILIYAALLAILMAGLAAKIVLRVPVDVDVIRDRNTLYRVIDGGRLENVYSVRIINKDRVHHVFRISAEGLEGAVVDSDLPVQEVPAEDVKTVVIRVRAAAVQAHGARKFALVTEAVDSPGIRASTPATFLFKAI